MKKTIEAEYKEQLEKFKQQAQVDAERSKLLSSLIICVVMQISKTLKETFTMRTRSCQRRQCLRGTPQTTTKEKNKE